MGSIKEYSKNHPIRFRFVAYVVGILIFSLIIVAIPIGVYHADGRGKVDSAIVNGILTSEAIIFGFVTYEIREIKLTIANKFLLNLPLLLLLTLVVTGYFFDTIQYRFITNYTMTIATVGFIFSLSYSVLIMILKEYVNS